MIERKSRGMSRRVVLAGAGALVLAVSACGDSSTAPGGESEVISRVTLTLTPPAGGAALSSFIDDSDGNGPTAPSAQVGALALARGVTYTGTVKFENRLKTPAEDITAEVQKEANEHRVFYTVTNAGVTITTTDVDGQNRPLGLRFSKVVTPAASGIGTVRVVLCHYGSTSKVATATSCTGDTDISLTFNFTIAP
ncbi:type 1 periplasmic binding fold superfamily protein [Gemmatimonas sp.]|uniref:type 1 periplasmic binding fold superfamily protein n=1 Tax=Gemmatimonas sp. TaxID=1962908 RepID=UPI003563F561